MTIERREPSAEVPTADLVDQATPIDPSDEEERIEPLRTSASPVSEGDWVDQQKPVPLNDDTAEESAI